MSILTQSGRAAIAASIKEQPIHLAWGSGDANWESSHTVEKFFSADGKIPLDHYPVKDVKVFTGQTSYQSSVDYTVDSSTGIVQRTENSSIAAGVTIEYTQDAPHLSPLCLKNCSMNLADVLLMKSSSAAVMKMANSLLLLVGLNHQVYQPIILYLEKSI